MNRYYVLLTGSKNNAGDFLIKERARQLLKALRPDREVIALDGWKQLTDDQLELVNGSEALLLTGGPAITHKMRPGVYALRNDLAEVRVPITTFGVGWSSPDGRTSRVRGYRFNEATKQLLTRIEADGLSASVRDFHSRELLVAAGLQKVLMTACPATYSLPDLDSDLQATSSVRRVTLSAGVHMARSGRLWRQTLDLVQTTLDTFPDAELTVAFHHSLGESFRRAYGRTNSLFHAQRRLVEWLEQRKLSYVDISGSHALMLQHYGSTDLHVGYRVHAHVLMTSLRKPSLLVAEDGRGMALAHVLGGHIYPAFERYSDAKSLYEFEHSSLPLKAIRRLIPWPDPYDTDPARATYVLRLLQEDQRMEWARSRQAILASKAHWETMRTFLASLP